MNPYRLFPPRNHVEEVDSDYEYDPSEIRYPDEVLSEESDVERDEYGSDTDFDEFETDWDFSPFHVIRFVFTDNTEDEGYGEFTFELPLSPITFSLASSLLYDVERFVIDRIREEQLQELENEEERKRQEAKGVTEEILQKLPVIKYAKTEEEDVCAICLCDFDDGESLKVLPCTHHFHPDCIDRWLLEKRQCPLCKAGIGNSVKEMMELFKQKQEQINILRQQTPRLRTPRTPRIPSATRKITLQRPATSKPSLTTSKPTPSVNNNAPTTKSSTSQKPKSAQVLRKSESTSSLPPATKPPARTASIVKKSEIPSLSNSKLPPIKSPRTLGEKPKASPKSSKTESLPRRF